MYKENCDFNDYDAKKRPFFESTKLFDNILYKFYLLSRYFDKN
jgi:hypothetical protein